VAVKGAARLLVKDAYASSWDGNGCVRVDTDDPRGSSFIRATAAVGLQKPGFDHHRQVLVGNRTKVSSAGRARAFDVPSTRNNFPFWVVLAELSLGMGGQAHDYAFLVINVLAVVIVIGGSRRLNNRTSRVNAC
jgi:hypothetical protein